MIKRKIIAIISAMFIIVGSAAGCSNVEKENEESAQKIVKVYQMKVEINDQLQKLAQKYEEETGVKVEVTSVGGGADYGASLKAEFQKGSEPDIFIIQGTGDYEMWKHKIADLSSEPWISKAVSGTLDMVTIDGKTYGMPAATEGYGLIYNKEILDKAGIDASAIDTFDELKSAFEILDSKKTELGIENVVSYTTKETWVTGTHTFNVALAAQDDPIKFTNDYIAGNADVVNNQQFKDWTNLVELLCKYGGGKTLETIDYSNQVGNFALGKTAFIKQGNWIATDLNSLGVEFDMGIVPLCINNDPEISGRAHVGVPMYWTVNKDSTVSTEAKEFLNWMVESEDAQKAAVNDMDMISAFTNNKVESENQLNKAISEYNINGKTLTWPVTIFSQGYTMNNIGPTFSKFLDTDMGEKAKADMLQQIQDVPKQ